MLNDGGVASVDVGNGSLANINFPVHAFGLGSTVLLIDDSSDTASHSATLSGDASPNATAARSPRRLR